MSPIVITILSVAVTLVAWSFAKRIENGLIRGIAKAGAAIGGLVVIAVLAGENAQLLGTASQYWFGSMIVVAILSRLGK